MSVLRPLAGRAGPVRVEFGDLKTLISVALAALTLAGCGKTEAPKAEDKYAGLSEEILAWRGALMKSEKACLAKADGCVSFEVGCKGERPVSPQEAAQGVTAKVVTAMSWNAWDPAIGDYRAASGFKLFTKKGGAWTSQDTAPVNLSTCG